MIEILAKFRIVVRDRAAVDARGYVIIPLPARCFERNTAGGKGRAYTSVGLLALPSGYDQAKREASNGVTATDTDSCAFSF